MTRSLIIAIILSGAVWGCHGAGAHDAPEGWSYGWDCCSGQDCRQVEDDAVTPTDAGWFISATGETIPYNSSAERRSKDGHFHRCSHHFMNPALPDKTICIYVPGFSG